MALRASIRRLEILGIALAAAALALDGRAAVMSTQIGGTAIFVPILDTVVLEPTIEPPEPTETTPLPPLAVHFFGKTTHSMLVQWADGSSVESGYRVEWRVGSQWVVVAWQGPVLPGLVYEGGEVRGSGQYLATGLRHDTEYCFRAVPWNAYGEPLSVPIGCARTNRLIGVNTVLVTDVDGFRAELDDPTPPPLPPGGLGIAFDPNDPAPTPPDPSGFPVPAAVKIIYVADGASFDLTDVSPVYVPTGITIASGRRGMAQGALLHSTKTTDHVMLRIVGDDVRITGLRFRGPSASTSRDNGNAMAIQVYDARDVVIDHNEFFRWPGAGIEVRHHPHLLSALTAHRVRITENHFHHNQRQERGYGVTVKDAAYAYIDKNTFDWNRHAIESFSKNHIVPGYGPESGYLAYLNLVLPGHAVQDGLVDWQTHHFDVHGSEDNWLGVDYYDGWAGEFFDVADNSFLGILGTAFNVRGTPSSSAQFHHNVLPPLVPHPQNGMLYGLDGGNAWYGWLAVNSESDRDNVDVYANQPIPDPRRRLAVGDFDGDRRDDVFLATGRAWYVSYGGVTEWRFLNKSTRRLSTLSFTDLDGDGRTDVLSRIGGVWNVSRSGSGAFVPLATTPVVGTQSFYSGSDLIGDFSGDDVLDRLRFDLGGDRYFRTVDGRTGATRRSRHQM